MLRMVVGIMTLIGIVGCASAPPPPPAKPPPPRPRRGDALSFCVKQGETQNCLLTADRATAHALVTSGGQGRIVVATPSGNAGVALWLAAGEGEKVSLEIVEPPQPIRDGKLRGVKLTIASGSAKLLLRDAVMGSVRIIRAHQPDGTTDPIRSLLEDAAARLEKLPKALRQQAAATGATPESLRKRGIVELKERRKRPLKVAARTLALDGEHHLRLEIHSELARWDADENALEAPRAPYNLELRFLTDYPQVVTLPPERLFKGPFLRQIRQLQRRATDAERQARDAAINGLSFLTTTDKLLAGSWRFLTYFGRDTLMTLLLSQPVFRRRAMRIGLQSVLDRLSPEGRVAHEESVGDQAARERLEAFVRLAAADKHKAALQELSQLQKPLHDYKMLDDDFMLPLVVKAYANGRKVTRERFRRFMSHQGASGRTNLESLALNMEYVLGRAAAFVEGGKKPDQLVGLLDQAQAGDWRDSEQGLGGGRYPASVNLYLVQAAVRATGDLLKNKKLDRKALAAAAKKLQLTRLSDKGLGDKLKTYIEAWQGVTAMYEIKLSPDEIRKRLKEYLRRGKLSREEKRLLGKQELAPGFTLDYVVRRGKLPRAIAADGLVFDALALDAEGKPVEVMHSDDGLAMLACKPPLERLSQMLHKYELNYPLGLINNYGVYVANPVLSSRHEDWATFGRDAYHGTVVWSWQLGLLQRGLMRQLARVRKLKTDQAGELERRIETVLQRMAGIEQRVGELRSSELWTVEATGDGFRAAPFAPGSGHAAEANVVQLWSAAALAAEALRRKMDIYEED